MWSNFLLFHNLTPPKQLTYIDSLHHGPTTPLTITKTNLKAKEKSFILKEENTPRYRKVSQQSKQVKMIMMMINSNSGGCPDNQTTDEPTSNETITTPWKLYENPFYYSHQTQHILTPKKQFQHHIHLPRKLATSFWDVRFIGPVMDSELDQEKSQIIELKAELEFERKARRKMENVNKKLVRELSEERQGREALEKACEELEKKVSINKTEINKIKKEIGEERKMLRMAEVFREERVQMKLTEAKFLLEDKVLELERIKRDHVHTEIFDIPPISKPKRIGDTNPNPPTSGNFSREETKHVSEEKLSCKCHHKAGVTNSMLVHQRKPSPEPENPHIKRGIKGFVEYPKVVRVMGSKTRHFGTKLECQKAQLNLLLKQKSPIRSSNLIMS